MSPRRALIALCTLLLLLPAAAPQAAAAAAPLQVAQQQRSLTLDQAARLVQERTGGRVLVAEVVRDEERTYYLIRVLVRKGQVKAYRVDPRSGRIF